jgi:hypothetical protein
MSERKSSPTARGEHGSAEGVSRRHLVRAGMAAAPVLAALKSNTVLAGGNSCVRPSAFSSLTAAHMKVSHGRVIQMDFECAPPEHWRHSTKGLPKGFKVDTLFISSVTGFRANQNSFQGLTLQQVLESTGSQNHEKLARYVVAAFLSAVSVGDTPSFVLLTKRQCREIWNRQGNWSPFAGANWSMPQTLAYFEKIFGPAFL